MRPCSAHALALLAPALVLACTDARWGEGTAREQSGIYGGQLSVAADDAVVNIYNGSNNCTGTLIAPNVVLTAMHCVTEFDSQARFACNSDGSLAVGSTGSGMFGPPLDPARIQIQVGVRPGPKRPVAKVYTSGSTQVCKNDIALLTLPADLDIGGASLVTLRFDRPTRDGELTRVIGYGNTVVPTEPGRQERDHVPVVAVGDPDAVTKADKSAVPHTIVVGEGPCQGDSGGPLLSEDTGAQIGVYSLLDSTTCVGPDVHNTYTQVAPFETLIRMVLTEAGHEPLVEPPEPSATGGSGGTGSGGTAPEQAGEGGAPGEAGAPSETGGTGTAAGGAPDGSGGTGGSAGGDTTGGTGAVAGSATSGTTGTDTSGDGSGSRRDPSCTCRTAGAASGRPWFGGSVVLALGFALRRRSRGRGLLG